MKFRLILLALPLLLVPFISWAEEGFSTSVTTAPAAIRRSWLGTFALLTKRESESRIATATLVGKLRKNNVWYLFFLTADHAVDPNCSVGQICPNTYLIQDLQGDNAGLSFTLLPFKGLKIENVEVVKRSNSDLAVLSVVVDATQVEFPGAVPLDTSCQLSAEQKVYTIGYPATQTRTQAMSDPIAYKQKTQKRWSQGLFIDRYRDGQGIDLRVVYGLTVDALEGSSGGPVLNANGELVGVILKTAASIKNGFSYQGNEAPNQLDWHALSARCEDVRELLLGY